MASIPVVDITGDEADIARRLVAAAAEHGFVYIRNGDMAPSIVDRAFEVSRRLFDSPVEDKQRCRIQQNNRGWSSAQDEVLDQKTQASRELKEAFNFGEFQDGRPQQPLPAAIASDVEDVAAFQDACYWLSLRILTLLGIGLEVEPPTFFRDAHERKNGPSDTTLRFLRYPPLSDTDCGPEADRGESVVRAGAHSDYGSVTFLFRLRGQAGLEIRTPDGSWAPVPVYPPGTQHDPAPPILMNIADMLSFWTNGLLRSTVHRVVFPARAQAAVAGETVDGPRYSIAYFVHPIADVRLTPVPSERIKQSAAPGAILDRPMTAGEYLRRRLKASYAGLYHDAHEHE